MTVTSAGFAVSVRRATPADSAARCDLFARVAMDTDLVLAVDRSPDFDALYRLQSDTWRCWVAELNGEIHGLGTVIVRQGYLGGEQRPIGYLGDLRLSPRLEGRHLLNRIYGPLLFEAASDFGCDLFMTAVIASNTRALRALTVENRRTRGRPRYTPLREFSIRSLHLTRPRRRVRTPYSVRRASAADVRAIARFLDADSRNRPFGYVFAEEELSRRLACWPGLTPGSFYLAEDRSGTLVGCVAVWDAWAVKRTVVLAYRGAMRRIKLGYDLAARLLRFPTLPNPGEPFRYLYATHQAIPSNDPRVMRALLDAIYSDFCQSGYHFISFCVLEGDALGSAFGGFRVTDLAARLFVVCRPDVELPAACFAPGRPGFEMALV